MRLKQKIFPFFLILILSSFNNGLYSQKPVKPSRQSSMEAFSKGNYEQAYAEFTELLKTYSKDPLYKYYSAVSLVKLNRKPGEARTLLEEALTNAASVKSLPEDALFYLGRTQQMTGDFKAAEETYKKFAEQAGKKLARENDVALFIQQCMEGKGKIAETGEKIVKAAGNDKSVDKATTGNIIIPTAQDEVLDEAMVIQKKADSLSRNASGQKKQMQELQGQERIAIKNKLSQTEQSADSSQKAADKKYSEAVTLMNPEKAVREKQAQVHIMKNDTAKTSLHTITQNNGNKEINIQAGIQKIERVVNTSPAMFTVFEILPKPVTDPEEEILINPEIPEGLIYRIQMAVFRNNIALGYFKAISPIHGLRGSGSDKTVYYAGMFRRAADASKALTAVKAKGFKDSFIVALMEGKTVSTDRAAMLEKEWGKKPFINIVSEPQQAEIDTIPPTLVFRVEVGRSPKPLKDEVVESMRKIAGTRGLDIITLSDGNTIYLIGNFITFESAEEYSDLLIRNGFSEAKVVAWLGKREISVETAKQLFENLK